ncbi:MAG: putative L-lysine 2,3-aminomutase [Ignavibacteriaceae bacterium]|nr:MAG: lysine 2,3-aminomutase [Chlorobiota bacterium]MBE7475839.1 lysine 2,3-aminomutase [Ignavibacteriales bacterium]MCE7857692.1 lysine 2,3-aminomutase [Ignavibacteria bacterium CHB3]NUM62663.1 lysine 2,3-aminomutase [Ignavibacteriaceae bacterium]GJQ41308.1 MAG: putative L-lysine 2,3-aminomutase [Ignavibacteriaceae bacterium]
MTYKSYMLHNYKSIPQVANLSDELIEAIDVVGSVLPFKTNNYVVENLIDWKKVPDDPIFTLTFPRKNMLREHHYIIIKNVISNGASKSEIKEAANKIRLELNPQPAGQLDHNVPQMNGEKVFGMQHKYRETILFFPGQGQTCHAYCTFCFRWPQFVGMDELKFASKQAEILSEYISQNQEVTDVLFTGGDPLIMKTKILETYIRPLLEKNLKHLRHIRIGTKALAYWPFRFLTDDDADDLLRLFSDVKKAGKHLAFMAHFNHPVELKPPAVKQAIDRILKTGAVIRTQSPVLKHINDSPKLWAEMWQKQVALGCIPYYMFVARNTGADHYFSLPLVDVWKLFREAYQSVSGICRSVRGPSMSCLPGKMQILGVNEIGDETVFTMRFIQGRGSDWVAKSFFTRFDENATWYTDLKPAFGEDKFFFTDELNNILKPNETEIDFE